MKPHGHAPPPWLQRHGLAIAGLLLAALTVYCAYDLPQQDWRGLGAAIARHWHLALAALAINLLGVCGDGFGWYAAYRAQGARFSFRAGLCYFLSVFALQLTPLQLGRLVRAAFAFRAGRVSLRGGITAEAVLFTMDVASLAAVMFATLLPVAWWPLGVLVVLLTGPAVLAIAEPFRGVLERRFGQLSEKPFLVPWNLAVYAGRTVDCLCVSTVLWLCAQFTGLEVDWQTAALGATGASLLGGLSTLPGGVGASEGVLLAGIHVAVAHAAKLQSGLIVLAYRLLTFWMWIPLGWLGLLAMRRDAARAHTSRM